MARLSQRSFQKVLDCIGEIYTHHDLDSFARRSLVLCRKLVASDYAVCDEINLRRQRHQWFVDPAELEITGPDEKHAIYFREHPLVNHLRRTGDVPPLRFADFLSQNQYRETALYREVYRGFGVEHQLGFTLPGPTPQRSVALAFNRKRREFSEEDRLVFGLFRQHLFQAYHNAELVTQLRETIALTSQALEALPQVMVRLDARGRLNGCPPRARLLLADFFGASPAAHGKPPEAVQHWLRQQRLPGTRSGKIPAPREPLMVEREGRRLTIRLLADAEAGQMLVLEEQRTTLATAPLQRLGLTARQAEVLKWIAQGKTNPEIGTILGLSAGTVHKHTEHIFARLRVETRTAAAALAWESVGGGAQTQ